MTDEGCTGRFRSPIVDESLKPARRPIQMNGAHRGDFRVAKRFRKGRTGHHSTPYFTPLAQLGDGESPLK